jgi:hypothetical protein
MRKSGHGFGSRSRTLAVEPLEGRAMLAGNVSVSVSGGSLIVRGDNAANGVVISQVDEDTYAVTGFDLGANGNVATRINGQANGTLIFQDVTGDINVDLRNGNDLLGIGNSVDDLNALAEECGFGFGFGEGSGTASGSGTIDGIVAQQQVEGRFFVPRNLIVNTGNGHDGVAVIADVEFSSIINTGGGDDAVAYGNLGEFEDDLNVGFDLVIVTNAGNDEVCAEFLNVQGVINIQTGEGHDGVEVDDFDAGAIIVGTAGGHDFVDLDSFDTDREVVVTSTGGNDTVFIDDFSAGQGFGPNEQEGAGYVTVVTGAGNDDVELTDFDADGVVINTGEGHDGTPNDESPITVADASITHHLTIVTGGGNDLVLVEFVEAGNVVIDTGAGNDGTEEFPIEIYNVLFDNLTVVTGAGNDFVLIHSGGEEVSEIENNLTVNTGAGNDAVGVTEIDVGGYLNVILGAGNDLAAVGAFEGIGVTASSNGYFGLGVSVGKNLLLDAGAGNDQALIANVRVLNDLLALLGAGHDDLGILGFTYYPSEAEGESNDGLGTGIGNNLLIDAGAGDDDIEVAFVEVHNDFFAFLGAGKDNLEIGEANIGRDLLIDAGAGNDNVGIFDIFVKRNATILMGAGNDVLEIFSSDGDGQLRMYGGPGKDTLNNDMGIESNGQEEDVEVREFEVFNFID